MEKFSAIFSPMKIYFMRFVRGWMMLEMIEKKNIFLSSQWSSFTFHPSYFLLTTLHNQKRIRWKKWKPTSKSETINNILKVFPPRKHNKQTICKNIVPYVIAIDLKLRKIVNIARNLLFFFLRISIL